uniref:PBPe domain-containing protein n=1 Tax=Haemonchus contortus TaxID=6289 RepID=A0A7I4Z1W6_HAECO
MALTKNSTFKAFALLLIKVAVILYGATIIFWISTEYYYRSFIKICEERNKSTEVSSNDDYHYYEKDLLKAVQHYGQLLGVRFPRNARTSHIDCGRLLHEDKQSGHVKGLASSRVELSDQNRSMSCEDIRARVLPPKPLQTLQFGVAHARIVYEVAAILFDQKLNGQNP